MYHLQWENKVKPETIKHYLISTDSLHWFRDQVLSISIALNESNTHKSQHMHRKSANTLVNTQLAMHTASTYQLYYSFLHSYLQSIPLGGTIELQSRAPKAFRKAATAINPLFTCCCSSALYEEMIYFCGRELLKGKPQNIRTRISVTYVLCQPLPIRRPISQN